LRNRPTVGISENFSTNFNQIILRVRIFLYQSGGKRDKYSKNEFYVISDFHYGPKIKFFGNFFCVEIVCKITKYFWLNSRVYSDFVREIFLQEHQKKNLVKNWYCWPTVAKMGFVQNYFFSLFSVTVGQKYAKFG
jgi:hypothetical protein